MICGKCDSEYKLSEPVWRCVCGGLLDIEFETKFPLEKISNRERTLWRYREAIPVENDENIVTLGEGFTPLLKVIISKREVYIKQDHLFPSGSFKDRGASVMISKIKELGISKIVEDSSGNAGAAIAAYSRAAGIECDIYLPHYTSKPKSRQIEHMGTRQKHITGSRDDTARAAYKAAASSYYASHSHNPWFSQGTKTFAYEICEQLEWKAPDALVLPVGNGSLLLGAYIGFCDLKKAGVISKMPTFIAVQAANCAPLYHRYNNPETKDDIKITGTIGEGVAVGKPARGAEIIDAVRKTGGYFIAVDESEIKNALTEVLEKGYYIEPTSAVAIAGLEKYLTIADQDIIIVSLFTGHGLKAGEKITEIL